MNTQITIKEIGTKGDIALAVLDGHTLGCIRVERPHSFEVLQASVIKGAPWRLNDNPLMLLPGQKNVRLATEQDFKEFNLEFDGYKNSGFIRYVYNDTDLPTDIVIPSFGR